MTRKQLFTLLTTIVASGVVILDGSVVALALPHIASSLHTNFAGLQWYDFVFYGFYMLHFVLPITLALIIWKKRESSYWRYIVSYLTVSFSAFIMFLVFPAAPPWMASDQGIIAPITRITSYVWQYLGITDFPSLYNRISPNPSKLAMPP